VDDVLAESLPGFLAAFRNYFGREVRIEEAAWEIFHRFPHIPPDDMWGFFSALEASDFLATRPMYAEAVEGVRLLARHGHRLFVVTGRLIIHRAHTRRLLEGAGIAHLFEELVHRGDEAATEYKPRIARERQLDCLIEDELRIALAVARIPLPVLLVDRPWNRGEVPAGIARVTDWEQILGRIGSIADRRAG
jgi:hypothetical protein